MENKYNREYWNKINKQIKKHHYRGIMNEYKIYCYNQILSGINLNKKIKNILITDVFDEGFNCDHPLNKFSLSNKKVIGIDISDYIIKKVKKKIPRSTLICCDVRNLPFKNSYFDLIISPSTLDHFPKEDLIQSLKELKRVIKSTGKIVSTLNNKQNIWLHFYILNFLNINPYKYFMYTKKEIIEICKRLGLKISYIDFICHLPLPALTSKIMNIIKYIKKENFFLLVEKQRMLKMRFLTGELIILVLEKGI